MPVFAELPADLDTPLSAYLRLRPGPYSFLLESVEGGETWARYSFLGTEPRLVLTAKNGRMTLRHADGHTERVPDGNPLDAIRNVRSVRWTISDGRVYDAAALWKSVRFTP